MRGWLAGRSLARGLPAPVDDSGGWRVDTGQAEEWRRYVFARPTEGLRRLGTTITAPRILLKLCGDRAALRAELDARWTVLPATCMMVVDHRAAATPVLAAGYRLTLERSRDVAHAVILTGDGDMAASGYAAEVDGAFVYDRIATAERHRRRGLGRALMIALHQAKRSATSREILTATGMGRALYESLGWRVYTAYTTAALPG